MKPYKVRNHKGQSIVAEFETQPEAAAYIQSQDNPLLYVDFDEPKPVVEPRKQTKFELFTDENIVKPWFRYPFGIFWIWLGFKVMDTPNSLYGWGGIILGCFFMYEIALVGLVIGFFYFLFSSIGHLSIPAAILVGACIIGFAIYKKKS